MMHYLQQEELALLKHKELLAKAAQAQQLAHLPHERANSLPAFFQRLAEQGRRWVAPRRSVTVDGVAAAAQHQVC